MLTHISINCFNLFKKQNRFYLVRATGEARLFATTGKQLIPVGQEPTGISTKPTGISNSRRFSPYSRRLSAARRSMSGIRLFPSAADGNT